MMSMQQALSHMRYNELSRERRGGPRLYVEDNVDPERMSSRSFMLRCHALSLYASMPGPPHLSNDWLIITHILPHAHHILCHEG